MHDTTTTLIAAAVVDGVAIAGLGNSAME